MPAQPKATLETILNLLGFTATIPLREGLQSVVEWRMSQRSTPVR